VKEGKLEQQVELQECELQVLNSQIKCLTEALNDSEKACLQLLSEKRNKERVSFVEFLSSKLPFYKGYASDALELIIKKEGSLNESYISELDLERDFQLHDRLVGEFSSECSLEASDLINQNKYTLELGNSVEEGSVPPEIMIYLLQQKVIETQLVNHNLQRMMAITRWRQVLEYGKSKIKSKLCKIQEGTIENLETILERNRRNHDRLKGRVDKLEC